MKAKINRLLGKRKAAEKVSIFANPCTMQIMLLHFGDVLLKNQGKKTNRAVIEQMTEIQNYDAHEAQTRELCSRITRSSYPEMKRRAEEINLPDTVSGSTNISGFLSCFVASDDRWITEIRKAFSSNE